MRIVRLKWMEVSDGPEAITALAQTARRRAFAELSLASVPVTSKRGRRGLTHRAPPSIASAMAEDERQESLRLRVADEYRNHFHITVSIFKGITLGAAAYALLAILAANGILDSRVQITALLYWVGSFVTILVTYDGLMLNSLITIAAPNAVDLIIPFLYGISEFLLFPLLAPVFVSGSLSRSSDAALAHLAWWPLGVAVIGVVSSLYLINSQSALTATVEELPSQLQTFIRRVKAGIRQNQIANAVVTLIYLVAFFVLRFGLPHVSAAELRQWEGMLGLFVIVSSTYGIWSIEQMRHQLAEALVSPG